MTWLVRLLEWGVALILVGELGLRFLASRNPAFAGRLKAHDLLSVKIVPMGEFGFRQRPGTKLTYSNGAVASANRLGYRGPEVARAKPAGTIRIILGGGSGTHGWGVADHETLDEYMRRQLADQFPDRRFEVINLGFDGYDSFQDFERLRLEGLAYAPDVIVLNSGVNDVRNARFTSLVDRDPRTLLWLNVVEQLRAQEARGRPTLKALIKHYFYLAQFVGVVRDSSYQENAFAERAAVTEPNLEAVDYFERNIRRVAAMAAEHGIALALSTVPSAIPFNFSPDAMSPRDYWIGNAAITQGVRDRLDERMRRVAAELGAKGERVAYVEHSIAPRMFSDDAHLTAEGNAVMAAEFCTAAVTLLRLGPGAAMPQTGARA